MEQVPEETLQAALVALRETIADQHKEEQYEPSPSEYLTALLASLYSDDRSKDLCLLTLFCTMAADVSESFLRAIHEKALTTILEIGEIYNALREKRQRRDRKKQDADGSSGGIMPLLIQGAAIVLSVLRKDQWKQVHARNTFSFILQQIGKEDRSKGEYGKEAVLALLALPSGHHASEIMVEFIQVQGWLSPAPLPRGRDQKKMISLLLDAVKLMKPLHHCMRLMEMIVSVLEDDSRRRSKDISLLKRVVEVIFRCRKDITISHIRQFATSETLLYCPGSQDPLGQEASMILLNSLLCHQILPQYSKLEAGGVDLDDVIRRYFETILILNETGNKLLAEVTCDCLRNLASILKHLDVSTPKMTSATIVEHLLRLLSYKFKDSWEAVLSLVGHLFREYLKEEDDIFRLLKKLVDIRGASISTGDVRTAHAVESAVGHAIESHGIETIFRLMPIHTDKIRGNETERQIEPSREFFLPLVFGYGTKIRRPSTLQYYMTTFMPMIESLRKVSKPLPVQTKVLRDRRMYQLWSLLASFCVYPEDFVDTFPKLSEVFELELKDIYDRDVLEQICVALKNVVVFVDGRDKSSDEYQVLQDVASTLLPLLVSIIEKGAETGTGPTAHYDTRQRVIDSIEDLSRSVSGRVLATGFRETMRKFLRLIRGGQIENEAEESLVVVWLDLFHAMTASLDEESISMLYRAMKSCLKMDGCGRLIQKRVYKVIQGLCEKHTSSVLGSIDKMRDVLDALVGSSRHCKGAARQMRIRCLERTIAVAYYLQSENGLIGAQKAVVDRMTPIISELTVCVKDPNGKTRHMALEMLIGMCKFQGPWAVLEILMNILDENIETSRIASATIICISKVLYDYKDGSLVEGSFFEVRIRDRILAIPEERLEISREMGKAIATFCRVLVVRYRPIQLRQDLERIFKCLYLDLRHQKNRLRGKTKTIVKKCCRKLGYDEIAAVIPEQDSRLVRHLRKLANRHMREEALKRDKEEAGDDTDSSIDFHEVDITTIATEAPSEIDSKVQIDRSQFVHSSIKLQDEDFLFDRPTYRLAKSTSSSGGENAALSRDIPNDILDLLDDSMSHQTKAKGAKGAKGEDQEFDFKVSEDGRLLIEDESPTVDENYDDRVIIRRHSKRKERDTDGEEDNEDEDNDDNETSPHDTKGNRKSKRATLQDTFGYQYKARKAGGDMRLKGKVEPYAYIPLHPKLLSKRNRKETLVRYKNIGKRRTKRGR